MTAGKSFELSAKTLKMPLSEYSNASTRRSDVYLIHYNLRLAIIRTLVKVLAYNPIKTLRTRKSCWTFKIFIQSYIP